MQDAEEDDRRWPVLERTALDAVFSSVRALTHTWWWLRRAPRRHDNRQRSSEGPTMLTARTTCTCRVRGGLKCCGSTQVTYGPQIAQFI